MAQLSVQSPDRKGGFFDFLTGSLQKPAQSPDRQGGLSTHFLWHPTYVGTAIRSVVQQQDAPMAGKCKKEKDPPLRSGL
jgi:hypothetical protein